MTRTRKGRLRRQAERRENVLGTLMASGPFIGFLLFTFLPMILSLYVSFTELHVKNISAAQWVGVDNYIRLFTDDTVTKRVLIAMRNSGVWILNVPLNMGVSLFIANLIAKNRKGSKFVRTILFIPSICSAVGVTLMWKWIFDYEHGVLNTIIGMFGGGKVPWTTNSAMFMVSCLILSVWMYGTNIVLMQNARKNVNESVKEAARMDGASEMQVFWKVVFPAITPTLFYLLVTNLVAAVQEMQIMQLLASDGTGPNFGALTLSYLVYRMGNVDYMADGLGMASALGWLVAIFCILFTRLNFWLSKKWVHYD